MKKIRIQYLALIIFTLTVIQSCSKKFLEQDVPGRYPVQDFYKTDGDALQAMTAVYDVLQSDYNTAWTSMYLLKTLPSDESNAAGSGPGDQPSYQAMDKFTFDADNTAVAGGWRLCYYAIYRANKVIRYVDPGSDLRKRVIAEAKAIRAYCYLDLVTLWGDVPLVLDDIPAGDYTKIGRAKKEDVYAQIAKDLTDAIPVLPLKSNYSAADKFRLTKGAAQSILGKAYLYQQKWTDAATQFDAVITSHQYDLAATVGDVFSRAGEFGIESILEISFTDKQGYDWGNFPWGGQPESNIHIQLMGPRSDYYTKAPADSLIGGWGFNLPKAKLYQAYVDAGDVNRRKYTVMSETELKAAGGNWSAPNAWDYEGYFQRKYGTFSTQTTSANGSIPELNYGTNIRLIRYADVLLMAAEAYNKANNDDRSRTELKKVRLRAGLAEVTASGTALFDAIVKERQLELAFEGVRYIDLIRWGKAAQELGPLGFKANKHELLPIPAQDVKTAGVKQNIGY